MLVEFKDRMRAQGAPVDEWGEPGLSGDEIAEMLAPLGLTLPVEACVWWEWHNGATQPPESKFGPRKRYLSLSAAIKQYEQSRWVAEKGAEDWPGQSTDSLWDPQWFPIEPGPQPVVVDCGVPEDTPTPVRYIDWEDIPNNHEIVAASLGEMVSWRILALDCGAWQWDVATGDWIVSDELLPKEFLGANKKQNLV